MNLVDLKKYVGQKVTVKIDRPLGSAHPKFDLVYPINYGYISGSTAADGEEVDVYVLGVDKSLEEFSGVGLAVIHRTNDDDDKLVVVPPGVKFTDEEIKQATDFQEKYFKSIIIRQF